METLLYFLKGLGAGFVVAAPVGPVAVLCIRRTLARGAMAGYATGLGAAIADTCYGVIAAYGMSFIAALLTENEFWFRLVGGIVLLALGMKTLLSGPAQAKGAIREGLAGDFVSALVVTGTNPVTVIAFGAVFAAIGIFGTGGALLWAEALIVGLFAGSALWWAMLTGITALFRTAVSHSGLRWVNRVSAGVILLCGVLVLVSAVSPQGEVGQMLGVSRG